MKNFIAAVFAVIVASVAYGQYSGRLAPPATHVIIDSSEMDGGIIVTGSLTNAQLRATAVPVSGSITATGPLTDTQLRATAVPVSGPLTDTQLRAAVINTNETNDDIIGMAATASEGNALLTDILIETNHVTSGLDDVNLHDYMSATPGLTVPAGGSLWPAKAIAISSSECVAIFGAGGTTCPAMPTGAYMALLQNRGPNDAVCTLGGTTPTLSNGIRMAAQGAAVTDPTDGFGPFPVTNTGTAIKCITRTLDQVAGAAVEITYWSH